MIYLYTATILFFNIWDQFLIGRKSHYFRVLDDCASSGMLHFSYYIMDLVVIGRDLLSRYFEDINKLLSEQMNESCYSTYVINNDYNVINNCYIKLL